MATELSGCFIAKEHKLLVIHRNTPELNWWEIIGGKVKSGESSAYAAEREAQEEAGIAVKAIKRLYTYEFTYGDKRWSQDVWWANIESGTPYPREAIHDEIAWMGFTELRHHEDLSPALAHLVKNLVDGEVRL